MEEVWGHAHYVATPPAEATPPTGVICIRGSAHLICKLGGGKGIFGRKKGNFGENFKVLGNLGRKMQDLGDEMRNLGEKRGKFGGR